MVGDGTDGRFVGVNKGDLPGSARGLRGTSGTRPGHTQPTWPAVRVGADRRDETADASPGVTRPGRSQSTRSSVEAG